MIHNDMQWYTMNILMLIVDRLSDVICNVLKAAEMLAIDISNYTFTEPLEEGEIGESFDEQDNNLIIDMDIEKSDDISAPGDDHSASAPSTSDVATSAPVPELEMSKDVVKESPTPVKVPEPTLDDDGDKSRPESVNLFDDGDDSD